MDLSAAHHQQLLQYPTQSSPNSTPTTHTLNNMTPQSTIQQSAAENSSNTQSQTKPRPPETEPQQCPRCESTNTKFCYFNNYSLTQPRYFCKACRRYWTKGGTLRNVPVGGGCRKSAKRASSNSPNSHYLKRPHTQTQLHPTNPVFSGYPAGMVLTEFDAGFNNFLGHQAFLQDLQYGNGGGGFMFQNNYEGGNSNSGSVISDEVKQERVENGAFWEAPWQNGNRMMVSGEAEEAVRDNWNGLYANNYSVLGGLLNSPAALM